MERHVTSDTKYRTVVSKVRRQLLDAIAFYQEALSNLKRSDAPPLDQLLSASEEWRRAFRHRDDLGWPGHLTDLANEAEHLAERFDREVAMLHATRPDAEPRPDVEPRPDAEPRRAAKKPDTGRYCA